MLIILGLFSLAGAVVWFGLKTQPNNGLPFIPGSPSSSASSNNPSLSQDDRTQSLLLESDRNVSYSKLRDDLQQNWKAADRETYERLLEAAGSKAQAQGFTPQDEMDTFSCKDLRTIDRLWNNASNGKFGFAAQQGTLRALGDYRKMYD
ncbi:MAG: GUN4 domain-containing protein [Phormidesmis sp. CAN_BIN44]|nr:GUN4 domain-containing protein [Phormidesmis sp. CAN_BIN44]